MILHMKEMELPFNTCTSSTDGIMTTFVGSIMSKSYLEGKRIKGKEGNYV